MKCMSSFIKIAGAFVFEKNGHIGQTFVVIYIGFTQRILNIPGCLEWMYANP